MNKSEKQIKTNNNCEDLKEDQRIMDEAKSKAKSLKSPEQWIIDECEELKNMLLSKNAAYGDSALNPANIFSKLDAVEAIKIRLDDKLKRIQNKGINNETIDTLMDISGYLILLNIAIKREGKIKEWNLQDNKD